MMKSSYSVFCSYVEEIGGSVSAIRMFGTECFEEWKKTRRRAPAKPEESFRRALTAHCRGSDGRQPFTPEVEESVLEVLRRRERWPCFREHKVSIGVYGFKAHGYHESIRLGLKPSSGEGHKVANEASPEITQSSSEGSDTEELCQEDDIKYQTRRQSARVRARLKSQVAARATKQPKAKDNADQTKKSNQTVQPKEREEVSTKPIVKRQTRVTPAKRSRETKSNEGVETTHEKSDTTTNTTKPKPVMKKSRNVKGELRSELIEPALESSKTKKGVDKVDTSPPMHDYPMQFTEAIDSVYTKCPLFPKAEPVGIETLLSEFDCSIPNTEFVDTIFVYHDDTPHILR